MHAALLFVVGLIAAHAYTADGHGLMYKPLSRNYRSYMNGGFGYNGLADGLAGGGELLIRVRGAVCAQGGKPCHVHHGADGVTPLSCTVGSLSRGVDHCAAKGVHWVVP
jgi:hypothetical protein